jgi:hypothetical protein
MNLLTKENLEYIIKNCQSYTEVIRSIRKSLYISTTRKTIKNLILKHNIDTNHFLRNKFRQFNLNDLYEKNKRFPINSVQLKRRLIKEKLKIEICEKCNLSEWLNTSIPLELHHKDGNKLNNYIENLQLLCPNCHSTTGNFRRRKTKSKKIISEEQFVSTLQNSISVREALLKMGLSGFGANYDRANYLIEKHSLKLKPHNDFIFELKDTLKEKNAMLLDNNIFRHQSRIIHRKVKNRPSREELSKMVWETSISKIATSYKVSSNAVKKWAESYRISYPPRGYWAKYYAGLKEECEQIKLVLEKRIELSRL